jgi:hypothetical protein
MTDIVPPVISGVNSSVGSDTDDNYEVGSIVKIEVTELNDEAGLTGEINITSVSNHYFSGDLDLVHNSTTKSYIYFWNTSGILPGIDYVVEANLTDFDKNYDGDGSNNSGPDLVIKFTDNTPPVISVVDSFVGTDDDEVYETNSIVRIKVIEKFGEIGLSGSLIINSTKINYTSGLKSLSYDDINGYYFWDWNTTGILPANDFWVETMLEDPSNNADLDGIIKTPDLVIKLQDTIAPVISNLSVYAIDPFGDKDTDGRFEIRSVVNFTIVELYGEPDLIGTISINSVSAAYSLTSEPLEFDPENNVYRYTWNTFDLPPASDYLVETTLADSSMNFDNDGFNNTGPDIIIELQDSIPPDIYRVDSYVVKGLWGSQGNISDDDEVYELGTVVRFRVFETLNDPTLLGTLRIYSLSQSFDTGPKQLSYNEAGQYYYWDWNTTGLQVANDYKVEATLQDSSGNKDNDGSISGAPDLVVVIQDTTPPVVTSVSSIELESGDTNGIYELGSIIRIIIIEQHNELGLFGSIEITMNSKGFNFTDTSVKSNTTSGTYYYDWDTSVDINGIGNYEIEVSLQDLFDNNDTDGLPVSPDLIIEIVDNTLPDTVKNVNLVEDQTDPGKIEIKWDDAEAGSTIYIYRSKSPLVQENLSSMAPVYISTSGETSYVDTVPADGSTYYYAVIIEDANGNINWALTEDNTDSIQVTKPSSDKETEDSGFKLGDMWWLILIIIIIVIVVIVITVFFLTRKTRRYPKDEMYGVWREEGGYEQPPPPRPGYKKRSDRMSRDKGRERARKPGIDWDEVPEPDEVEEPEYIEEPTLHVKPGGKAKKYDEDDLDNVRAALWEDIQDEFGESPRFVPEGAQDYDYDEVQEYTEYDDYEVEPTSGATPTEDAAVDIFSDDKDDGKRAGRDEDEDEDEEVFEVDFDDDEDEFDEDDDVDWE